MKTNAETFDQEALKSELPVLVDFYATWCGPCKMLAPVLDEIAKRYEGRAKVVKVDIDESPELAQRYSVTAVPTLVLFKDGKAVQQVMGFQSPKQLSTLLDGVLAPK